MIKVLPMIKLAVFGFKIPSTQTDKMIDTSTNSGTITFIDFLKDLLSIA